MSYYIDKSLPNGDRDDLIEDENDDVTEKKLKEEPKKDVPLVKKTEQRKKRASVVNQYKIAIPKTFDDDWYNSKVETAKAEKNYYNAKKFSLLKSYASIVYDFYTQTMYQFNESNNILDMPEYIKNAGQTKCDLHQLATILSSREEALLNFFNRDAKKMNAELKSVHYEKLKNYAAKSWMLYYSGIRFGNLTSHLKFMEGYVNSADFSQNWKVANCYRLHKKAEYRMGSINNFFNYDKGGLFTKEHPMTFQMYRDIDSKACYTELLRDVGAYIPHEREDQMNTLKNGVKDGVEKMIIDLYDNYDDIKYLKYKLNYVYEEIKSGSKDIFIYEDALTRNRDYKITDVYERAKRYVSLCEKILLRVDIKSRMFEEVNSIYEELSEVIELNQEYHYELVEVEFKEIEDRLGFGKSTDNTHIED